MSNTIPSIQTEANAIGFTKLIQTINTQLDTDLTWLDKPLGRAFVSPKNMPLVYFEENRYYEALPNRNIQGFCFYLLDNEETTFKVVLEDGETREAICNFSLIVWLNTQHTAHYNSYRWDAALDYIKRDIINSIRKAPHDYEITINSVQEGYENVFAGFDLDNVKEQHLSHPFYGYRLNLTTNFYECS